MVGRTHAQGRIGKQRALPQVERKPLYGSARPRLEALDPSIVDSSDPCDYLRREILPHLAPPPYGEIEAEMLSRHKLVYLFREKIRGLTVVAKFFEGDATDTEQAWAAAEREFFNLSLLRNRFGMGSGAHRVVRPLGKNKRLFAMLVTEKAPGEMLDRYIAQAAVDGENAPLLDTLGGLAEFLAKLHRSTETHRLASADLPRSYLHELLTSLGEWPLGPSGRRAIEAWAALWWEKEGIFGTDSQVLVHGDATPTNFLFDGPEVLGIDLERMKWADRCWDLGFMAAELKHHFAWRSGDGWAAEPFIGHFLWQYAVQFGDQQFFDNLTRKLPLFMALGLLRIARNTWLGEQQREYLVSEAGRCLEFGL